MIVIVNLYIYSILVTLITLILIWTLYKSDEEIKYLKKHHEKQIKFTSEVCKGCGSYYDNRINQYKKQIYADTDLINQLRKENWKLKNDR